MSPMPEKPAVVYAVTHIHTSLLAQISNLGRLDLQEGTAKFLEAICEQVWPSMKLRLTAQPSTADEPERLFTVEGLRQYSVHAKAVALTEVYWMRQEEQRAAMAQMGRQYDWQTRHRATQEEILAHYSRIRTVWAATPEEAREVISAELTDQGVAAKLSVGLRDGGELDA